MKKLSLPLLSQTVVTRRKELHMTQTQLATASGMNRSVLSNLETQEYTPSIDQLQALAEVLGCEPTEVFIDQPATASTCTSSSDAPAPCRIAVAGTGYVGLSLAILLAQHNQVTAVDIVPEKIEKLNNYISPIQDDYIEQYLAEAKSGIRKLDFTATMDAASAYADADYIIIAAPTNYDPKQNFFDCSAVESVIHLIKDATADRATKPTIVIKSTIPVGYTEHIRKKFSVSG